MQRGLWFDLQRRTRRGFILLHPRYRIPPLTRRRQEEGRCSFHTTAAADPAKKPRRRTSRPPFAVMELPNEILPTGDDVALVWRVRDRHATIQLESLRSHPLHSSTSSTSASHPLLNEGSDGGAVGGEGEAKASIINGGTVPESVLQYERQLRKAQHAKKAGAALSDDDLKVIHADEHVVVVSKPPGVLTVPGIRSNPSILELVHARFVASSSDSSASPSIPPLDPSRMIVHRLDMDTSGLVIFGRTEVATKRLHQAFRDRDGVRKEYQALVVGHWPSDVDSGTIELALQRDHAHPPFMRVSTPQSEMDAQNALQDLHTHGWKKLVRKAPKPSTTEFVVVERMHHPQTGLPCTRLRLVPVTGRTHQLRVHCAALGHPIVGDPTYGFMGEASPNGGIEFVPSVFLVENDVAASRHSENALVTPRCSLELQQAWNAQYVPNDRPMCLHASFLSLKHPITDEVLTCRDDPAF